MPARRRAAQLGEREPHALQVLEQRHALVALAPCEPVEQSLRAEVDARLVRHSAASVRQPGRAGRQASGGGRRITGRDRPRHRPRPGQHRLRRGGASRRAPGGARRRRDRDAPRPSPGERRLAAHPRGCRGAAGGARSRSDGARAAVLRPERAHRLRRRAGPRASRCWRRASTACPARATPRSRSRAPSAAAAARRRRRSRGWSRRCSGSRRSHGRTTPPTRSRSPSATPTGRRCRARPARGQRAMIALLRGEVARARGPTTWCVLCARRRLPRGRVRGDAAPRAAARRGGRRCTRT